jgi:hypothetical protein
VRSGSISSLTAWLGLPCTFELFSRRVSVTDSRSWSYVSPDTVPDEERSAGDAELPTWRKAYATNPDCAAAVDGCRARDVI